MTVQIVRFTTTEAQVADVEAAIGSLIAAIDDARPPRAPATPPASWRTASRSC